MTFFDRFFLYLLLFIKIKNISSIYIKNVSQIDKLFGMINFFQCLKFFCYDFYCKEISKINFQMKKLNYLASLTL